MEDSSAIPVPFTLRFIKVLKGEPYFYILAYKEDTSVSFQVLPELWHSISNSKIRRNSVFSVLECVPSGDYPIISSLSLDGEIPVEFMEYEPIQFTPISQLSVANNQFVVKARVLKKSEIIDYRRGRSMFTVDIIDQEGTEISANFFDKAVGCFYDDIQEQKVYVFSEGVLKHGRSIDKYPFRLVFTEQAVVYEVDDDPTIKKVNFALIGIKDIANHQPRSTVDVAGCIIAISPVQSFTKRDGTPLVKRVITLADETEASVGLTLWNEEASNPEYDSLDLATQPILVAKSAVVSDYDAVSLYSQKGKTTLYLNLEDASIESKLKQTPMKEFTQLTIPKPSKFRLTSLKEVQEVCSALEPGKSMFFHVLGYISLTKHDDPNVLIYTACSKCTRKIINERGVFVCPSCEHRSTACEYKFILILRVSDVCNSVLATAFDETATVLLNASAKDILDLFETNLEKFNTKFQELLYTEHIFKLRARCEQTDMGPKVKYTLQQIIEPDPLLVTRTLLLSMNY